MFPMSGKAHAPRSQRLMASCRHMKSQGGLGHALLPLDAAAPMKLPESLASQPHHLPGTKMPKWCPQSIGCLLPPLSLVVSRHDAPSIRRAGTESNLQ